jgi:flavocytochrome c
LSSGRGRALVVALLLATLPSCKKQSAQSSGAPTRVNAVVVGGGIAGLSAALELAQGGAQVVIVDMASIFGGHAVMATGDLCIVGTPFQEAKGIHDTPELAFKDFTTWGEDADPEWVRTYVNTSRREIYDWVTQMGVTFETFATPAGNSVLRTHRTKGRGLALVSAIYGACARNPNITFLWNTKVDRLLGSGKRVTGIAATNVRSGASVEIRADVVVLATGGFQSNLDMVRRNWPSGLPFPERMLVGSGMNSVGSGHELAREVGAALTRLDHQWNYITGLPDPRYPGGKRGLNAIDFDSVWVNADGKRFLAEKTSTKFGFPILAKQKGTTYWSIFDEPAKKTFWIAGSDWADFKVIDRLIFGDKNLVKSAGTLEELAALVGLPPAALGQTIRRYNELVAKGTDDDFGRFGPGKTFKPQKIATPPFYAVQFFPLTRKSMGGVAIDGACHVVDARRQVIGGLFAAGELTGLAGINGKAGLEGTFLGPSIVTGRVAGRAALAELGRPPGPGHAVAGPPEPPIEPNPGMGTALCLSCHDLPKLVATPRTGYWHFERVHTKVLAEKFECAKCHAELSQTLVPAGHRINRVAQVRVCMTCHKGEDR